MTMAANLNPYLDPYAVKGDQVSSDQEGRHVNILEGDLVHPYHADGFVDKGDPVSFGIGWPGLGVGIALKSAAADTDKIPVDTEGIWRCEIAAQWDMIVGALVFITSAGVLVDWPPDENSHIFGYTLQPLLAGTGTIAVKVHWMDTGVWWWWFWMWENDQPKY